MQRKKSDINIDYVDVTDEETGEINRRVYVDYNPDTHRIFTTDRKHGIPKKAKKPFAMVTREDDELTLQEAGILFKFIKMVGWEDNHIQKNGKYLNITEIAEELKLTRQYVNKILLNLEKKKVISFDGNAREKTVIVNSSIMWHGKEKSRSLKS